MFRFYQYLLEYQNHHLLERDNFLHAHCHHSKTLDNLRLGVRISLNYVQLVLEEEKHIYVHGLVN